MVDEKVFMEKIVEEYVELEEPIEYVLNRSHL